jgi:hypothetical protein
VREPTALKEAIERNRQRLAFDQLAAQAPWLVREAADVMPAERSQKLDAELRGLLGRLRPQKQGELLVTHDLDTLCQAVFDRFESLLQVRFNVFLAHWVSAGAIILEGTYLRHHICDLLVFDGDTVYGCTEDNGEVFAVDRSVFADGVTFEMFWTVGSSGT